MRALCISFVALLVGGCDQTAFDLPPLGEDPPEGPGSPQWGTENLACSGDTDCSPGETCGEGTCRPRQCDDGPYESAVPLGPRRVFYREQEVIVTDSAANAGEYWVDGYDAAGALRYDGGGGGSISIGTTAISDVARITTRDGAGVVTAAAGTRTLTLAGRGFPTTRFDAPFVPVAIAAGDVDGDATEDIVALAANGEVAVCSPTGACRRYTVGTGQTGIDIATGDMDGDGVAEVILTLRVGTTTTLAAWSVDAEEGGFVAAGFTARFVAVTAGDFDGDGRAEIAALEDGGYWGWGSDKVHLYQVGASFTPRTATSVASSAIDVAAGDVDGSDTGDVLGVLGSNREVTLLDWTGSAFAARPVGTTTATSAPLKLALGDLDDDSVSATLVSGPELVAGKLLPTVVVNFPPYDASVAGTGVSAVAIGKRTDVSTDMAETITLQAGVEVGVEAEFASVFKAKLSTKLSTEIKRSRSLGRKWSVGTKFSLRPDPGRYGNDYGAVVVACNCFHTYVYELNDPANRAGGTGHRITVVVPVGGQTTVLSTPRYRALAAKLGGLPAIETSRRIGDPATYPRDPRKLDGTPVAADELVFPSSPTLRVSDVGTVAFTLSAGTSETNSQAMSTSVSVGGSVTIGGVLVGGNLGAGWGSSYSITVGEAAEFSGEVPPMPDDPSTQEDEYVQHAFSYSPYVYQQAYTDTVTGEASGYYVLDYTVSGP